MKSLNITRFLDSAHNGFKVKIKLLLRPEDISEAPAEYRQYWFDNMEKMLDVIK
ncbi:MAG: hypothetical protein WBC40_05905 [Halobacteriota archaeon]